MNYVLSIIIGFMIAIIAIKIDEYYEHFDD